MTVQDRQCAASSWRGVSHRPYGPGHYNRCKGVEGHTGPHIDDFGNVFRQAPKFKVVRQEVSDVR